MYHETLREALDAVGVGEFWPLNQAVCYGETVRVHVDDGSRYGRIISVYRHDQTGRYETPVTYEC